MGKVVIVNINKNGKIELTKEELEKIIEDAYQDGYNSGYTDCGKNHV